MYVMKEAGNGDGPKTWSSPQTRYVRQIFINIEREGEGEGEIGRRRKKRLHLGNLFSNKGSNNNCLYTQKNRVALGCLIAIRHQPTMERTLNISRKMASGPQMLIPDILFMYEKCLNMYELLRWIN